MKKLLFRVAVMPLSVPIFCSPLLGNQEVRVATSIPIADGALRESLCAVALQMMHSSLVAVGRIPESREVATSFSEETFDDQSATGLDSLLPKTLIESRILSGESHYLYPRLALGLEASARNSSRSGTQLTENAYSNLVSARAVAQFDGWVMPFTLKPTADGGMSDPIPGVPYRLDRRVLEANPGNAGVEPISVEKIPKTALAEMNAFDYFQEILGLPHSIDAYNFAVNTDGSHGVEHTGRVFYSVSDETGNRLGYILEILGRVYQEQSGNSSRRALQPVSALSHNTSSLIRFDRDGNRVSQAGYYSRFEQPLLRLPTRPDAPGMETGIPTTRVSTWKGGTRVVVFEPGGVDGYDGRIAMGPFLGSYRVAGATVFVRLDRESNDRRLTLDAEGNLTTPAGNSLRRSDR